MTQWLTILPNGAPGELRIRSSILLGLLAAGVLFALAQPASADAFTKRVCIGEEQSGCPEVSDPALVFSCGTDPRDVAQIVCRGDGVQRQNNVLREGSRGGGRCGYEWYLITCVSN